MIERSRPGRDDDIRLPLNTPLFAFWRTAAYSNSPIQNCARIHRLRWSSLLGEGGGRIEKSSRRTLEDISTESIWSRHLTATSAVA